MPDLSVWDSPELRIGGEYVKFAEPGDSVAGVINSIRAHHWDDGSSSPQLALTTDSGEERTLTASQVQLKAALVEQRPDIGDHLTVTYTRKENRSGGKTLKHFDVKVVKKADRATEVTAFPAVKTDIPASSTPTVGRQSFTDDNPPF